MQEILLILFGFVGGIIGGMGMGGGTITIPLLVIWAGIEQHIAQFINLVIFLPMAIIAIIIHSRNGLVRFSQAFKIIICASVTAILGALLATCVEGENLGLYFGIFLAILGIVQFCSAFCMKNRKSDVKITDCKKEKTAKNLKYKQKLNAYKKK